MKLLCIFVLILICSGLYADKIEINDGQILEGAILGANNNSVSFHITDSTIIKIPHKNIKSLFFTYADMVYLKNMPFVKCKILDEVYPILTVVTENGLIKIRYTDVKRYFFNTGDSLTIPYLPSTETGLFNNEKVYVTSKSSFKQSISLGINGGLVSINTSDWEDKIISPSSSPGVFGGISVGYNHFDYLYYGLGYEYCQHRNTVRTDLEISFNTNFLYASAEINEKFVISFLIEAFAGLDIGLYTLNGDFYLYSYRNISFSNNGFTFALRPKAGIRFPFSDNLAFDLTGGYFLAETNTIKMLPKTTDDFSLKFNGIYINAGFKYYFPYSL